MSILENSTYRSMIKTWSEDSIYIILYLLAKISANEPELVFLFMLYIVV